MTAPDDAAHDRGQPAAPPVAPKPVMLRDLPRTVFAVGLLVLLVASSLWILRPFLLAIVWAMTIVVATWPLMLMVQARLKRRALAVSVMTVAMLLVFFAPVLLMIDTLAENTDTISGWLHALASSPIPPPPDWVHKIPLVGDKVAGTWTDIAASGRGGVAERIAPYATDAARWLGRAAGGVGLLVVQLLLTLLISMILYANGEAARATLIAFGRRLAGDNGERVVLLAGASIRAVAIGVVGTALAQTVLAGIGLAVAGIPFASFLTAVILLFCIAQIGPMIVLIPAVVWLFWTGQTAWGAVLLVWSLIVGTMDNVLRPFLIRKGADLPLLLIFAGVIGGLISFGIIGLFVGPVVLAIAYTLLGQWLNEPGDP
ncbi:MAG TPA: AI-2E family transporter YdiK [Burkholderiaceae bacterium]|nr:AI-2E family transporter YdiK [Burkholderiaceae bacterium]HSB99948.1 AI-2E family transporter YdiK [Burkholderiaceae bacterium]